MSKRLRIRDAKLNLTMQRILYEYLGHHQLQTDDHHVQQRQLVDHLESQTFVGEELDAHVDHPVAKRVRIAGHFQHGRYATVVHHKCAGEVFLHGTNE